MPSVGGLSSIRYTAGLADARLISATARGHSRDRCYCAPHCRHTPTAPAGAVCLAGGQRMAAAPRVAGRGSLRRGRLGDAAVGKLAGADARHSPLFPQAAPLLLADGRIAGGVWHQRMGGAPSLPAGGDRRRLRPLPVRPALRRRILRAHDAADPYWRPKTTVPTGRRLPLPTSLPHSAYSPRG
jgi:hypothetical protein